MTAVQRLIGRCVFVGLLAGVAALQADPGNYQQAILAALVGGLANAGFNVATPFNVAVGLGKKDQGGDGANVGGGGGLR